MIDTNAILDWLLDRHPERTKAVIKLLRSGSSFTLPDIAIAELVFALQKFYQFTRPEIATALTAIVKEPALICHRALIARATKRYVARPSLSFVDCCLLEMADTEDKPLWTFDKKLVNQSGGRAKLLK